MRKEEGRVKEEKNCEQDAMIVLSEKKNKTFQEDDHECIRPIISPME